MYLIVIGGGTVGYYLSRDLIERGEEVTLVEKDGALQLAKERFKVPRTIARVNNPANVSIFKMLGVDEAVSATEVLLGALEPKIGGQ